MSNAIIQAVEAKYMKSPAPKVEIGDTVDVHVRIIEGEKERVQIFSGVVIAQRGRGVTQTITVRRIVANEGVERIFPVHSPSIAKIEIRRHGHVRRSKLYYLRDRVGKSRRLRDRRRGLKYVRTSHDRAVDATLKPGETHEEEAAAAKPKRGKARRASKKKKR